MANRLSICMISDDFLPAATGVGVHIQVVAAELARRGHRVSVVTTRRRGERPIETWEGVTIHRVFTLKSHGFYQALPSKRALRLILQELKPDLIHHHYIGLMMARACAVAESLHIPQVSTYHFSTEVLTQPLIMRPFKNIFKKLLIQYCNRFDHIILPSANVAKQLTNDGVRTSIRFITNPVVFSEKNVTEPAERTCDFHVFYAGRLGVEKNVPYLLRAFAISLLQYADAHLWIAGHGPERQNLEALVDELGIRKNVTFLGFLEQRTLARYYAACDVFVLPSLVETQSLVVMEAMHFGRPVVVTSTISSATELVESGLNGYIVDPSSVEDLAARLVELARNPHLRKALGDAGQIRASAYRPELVVDETELVYSAVLGSAANQAVSK